MFDCLNTDDIIGFDWDSGNIYKNENKHNIKWQIIEEIFFNEPLVLLEDKAHSNEIECRCVALGFTNDKQLLTVIFTKRYNKIRVISARAMSKKERIFYENFTKI
ncbi:BrnT family toxin [Arcobacter vandammei]|uniref:BrnT family toxin n=1 Tax=Arcobacter vandammei TaxID=2782243 RepID=UPI0018DFDCF4|nr:BrnT family toxin [Arcobacter vandammei]